MENKKMGSEKVTKINKFVIISMWIMVGFTGVFGAVDFFIKENTIIYAVSAIVLGIIGSVAATIVYKKKSDSSVIRHMAFSGVAVMYIIIIYTTRNMLSFLYVAPVLCLLTLYEDKKFVITNSIGVIIINVINILKLYMKGEISTRNIDTIIIQMIVIVGIAIYNYACASFIRSRNQENMAIIANDKAEVVIKFKKVFDSVEIMKEDIGLIANKVDEFKSLEGHIKESISEVKLGTENTVSEVEKQIVESEEIQVRVKDVKEIAQKINLGMEQTEENVGQGKIEMQDLLEKSNESQSKNLEAYSELNKLKNYAEKMNSIVEIIQSITSQTSMLSLNASIEAARAGEAGKGFAVVALEISNLANQTEEATVNISDLIQNISGALNGVVTTINQVVEESKVQNQSALETSRKFDSILDSVDETNKLSDKLNQCVITLEKSNDKIQQSVQTISSVTEETTALSNETYMSSEKNVEILDNVNGLVQELNQKARELENTI